MNIEEAIEDIKLSKSTVLFGREQTIVNIEDLDIVLNELEKKDKMIEEYETGCRRFKAFCRRVRRDEKHDVDDFNQGQEHMCNQFLNLLNGDKNWSYEGKYFDEYDKEMEEIKQYFSEKAQK